MHPLLLLWALYVLVGFGLTMFTYRFLRRPPHTYTFTPLLEPEEFMPQGQRWRRITLWFWYIGLLVLVIAWLVP